MMIFDELTEKNVLLYAAKHYYKPQFSDVEEFYEDLKRFKYIKRLFKKYVDTKVLKERLLLNHFIVLKNVFGTDASVTLLLYKVEKEHWHILKSFLIYLNMIQENELKEIEHDNYVLEELRKI